MNTEYFKRAYPVQTQDALHEEFVLLIVVVLVRPLQPNYLIFSSEPPRYGRNT